MVNKISPHSNSSTDEVLAASVIQALDKSLDDIDDLSLQRLKNARKQALNQSAKTSRKWIPLSVAASFTALLLIPVAVHQYSLSISSDQDLEIVSQEVPYSTEEMDDIDMLMSVEDIDV